MPRKNKAKKKKPAKSSSRRKKQRQASREQRVVPPARRRTASGGDPLAEAALAAFAAVLKTLDPDAAPRLVSAVAKNAPASKTKKARLLLAQARGCHRDMVRDGGCTPKDVTAMAARHVEGVLEATFGVETALVQSNFADEALHIAYLKCLDVAHAWVLEHLVPACGIQDPRVSRPSSSTGTEPTGNELDEAEAREAVRKALKTGARLLDPGEELRSPPCRALGSTDLWEALCWRRGACRFYAVSPAAKRGRTDGGEDGEAAEVAPLGSIAEQGVEALMELLRARQADDDAGDDGDDNDDGENAAAAAGPTRRETEENVLLRWGIYGTTHLLALAYAGELAYWRWLGVRKGAKRGKKRGDAESQVVREDEEAQRWQTTAMRLVHRYLYVVEVKMEGCQWATERQHSILVSLCGGPAYDSLAPALQAWADDIGGAGSTEDAEDGGVKNEIERLSRSSKTPVMRHTST